VEGGEILIQLTDTPASAWEPLSVAEASVSRLNRLLRAAREPTYFGPRGRPVDERVQETLPAVSGSSVVDLGRHPALVYLAGLQSATSQDTQACALRQVARLFGTTAPDLPWHELRYVHVLALRSLVARAYAPKTANRLLTALRGALRAAWRLGLISLQELQAAIDVPPVRGSRKKRGRVVAGTELLNLTQTGKADRLKRRGARDLALVALCWGAGLRRAEAAGLDLKGYDGAAVTVIGKGNKERSVPVPRAVRPLLDAWIEIRGREPGPLLTSFQRPGARLRPEAIYRILQRLAARAGVAKLAPHDLRRTFITELLRRGADVLRVQRLAGHESPETTAEYDLRGEDELVDAVEMLPVPF